MADGRERILETAYELFSRHGTRAVGVDRIVAEAGAAKMTLYRNFASKDELIVAFLDAREQRWLRDWLIAEVEARATAPDERLLTIFDVFGEWFALPDFEGCSFINVMLEIDDREDVVARGERAVPERHPRVPGRPRGRGRDRRSRRLRTPVAHPHEGLDRRRRRRRCPGGGPCA